MRLLPLATFVAGLAVGAGALWLVPSLVSHVSPYAGEEKRAVSSLSAADIAQLEGGEGWGLAKPAELNGYPGPAHVIELADGLDLSQAQSDAVERSFETMRSRAKALGAELIAAERELDRAFEAGSIDAEALERLLRTAEAARVALRSVHLGAHLEVTPLLSDEQRRRYAALRGYGTANGEHAGHGGH